MAPQPGDVRAPVATVGLLRADHGEARVEGRVDLPDLARHGRLHLVVVLLADAGDNGLLRDVPRNVNLGHAGVHAPLARDRRKSHPGEVAKVATALDVPDPRLLHLLDSVVVVVPAQHEVNLRGLAGKALVVRLAEVRESEHQVARLLLPKLHRQFAGHLDEVCVVQSVRVDRRAARQPVVLDEPNHPNFVPAVQDHGRLVAVPQGLPRLRVPAVGA